MLNLFERNDQKTRDLLYSLKQAGFERPTVFLEDDGWLPPECESPFAYFAKQEKSGRPRYFNEVEVPRFWEIAGDNRQASIGFYGQTKAKIVYAAPKEKRWVKEVKWLDPAGRTRLIDHYDRYGHRFAQTACDEAQKPIVKTYFDTKQHEVLVQNFVTDDLILNQGEQILTFKNLTEFTLYYLAQREFSIEQIFINSLSYPLFVLLQLPQTGNDVLFWQEDFQGNIPGNMEMILNGGVPRLKKIVVQDAKAYQTALQLSNNSLYFENLGFIYEKKRENEQRKQIFILTNSDQLEQIETLFAQLPEFEFHIAAITEMSQKLMDLGHQANISLYPNVAPKELAKLWQQADFYLDINHHQELMQAVRQAFENEMLTVGFENTVHDRHFIAPENIYAPEQVEQMVQKLKRAASDRAYLDALLVAQRQQAEMGSVARYQEVLGG